MTSTDRPNNNGNSDLANPRGSWLAAAVAVLLLLLLPAQFGFWRRVDGHHPVLWSVALLSLAVSVVAVVALLRRRAWAPWPALCSLTWTATIVASNYASHNTSALELAAVVAAFVLTLLLPSGERSSPSPGMRVYYLAVATLTTYVAFWGLFFPNGTGLNSPLLAESFDGSLPFNVAVPTLHARMIGSLYLAATIVCVLSASSRTWVEARLGTWMILLWTASLLGITLTHGEFFDWNKSSVWFWYVAYIGFPAIAAWLLLHRQPRARAAEPKQLSRAAIAFFVVQGLGLALLAAILQFSPPLAASIWPWAILPLLSRFYSAPLITFGMSSMIAARCRSASEVRALSAALAAGSFALAIASLIHRDKFDLNGPAAWVWFGSLTLICVGNLAIAVNEFWPARETKRTTIQDFKPKV